MRIELACFTERGRDLGTRLVQKLGEGGDAARLERCGAGGVPLRQWIAERFRDADALIFVGAAGIAVRAVAPEIVSKTSDPAVVVVDDCGRFAVALLSGHIGGANALAKRIADLIGAVSVITTATDGNGVFAIDTWAKRNGLAIRNPERIKAVSAKLLAGERVAVRSAFPIAGAPPPGLVLTQGDCDVLVDISQTVDSAALFLIPPVAILGLGCRKGTASETIERAFEAFCKTSDLCPEAFAKVCSIDLKKEEPGLLAFCEKHSLPLETFTAGELAKVDGDFSASAFVQAVTGVDNVCERSAVFGGGGSLLIGRTVIDGVTMAAAVREYAVNFGDDGDGE